MKSKSSIRRMLAPLAALAILPVATGASAVTTLTLASAPSFTLGPQSASSPCIIAGTTCQNGTFAYTNFQQSGSITAYDEFSPNYLVSDLPFLSFVVAIDVNTARGEEYLNSFYLRDLTTNTVLYQFVASNGNGLIGAPLANNGNGFGDWSLGKFDLTGLALTDHIQFEANYDHASDGAESFFLVSTPAVPEPETYALMLGGLGIVGFIARRRKQQG